MNTTLSNLIIVEELFMHFALLTYLLPYLFFIVFLSTKLLNIAVYVKAVAYTYVLPRYFSQRR